jgi:hypothetical protein
MSENFTPSPLTRLELVKLLRGVSQMALMARGRGIDEADRVSQRLSFTLGIIGGSPRTRSRCRKILQRFRSRTGRRMTIQ